MTPASRIVRVTDNAFRKIDTSLGDARSAEGRPSAADFIEIELPKAIDRFATDFDSLPPAVPGVSAIRIFVGPGSVVTSYAVIGILLADDSIALIGVEIEL